MVPVNYLAVLISAILAMGLGYLWYGKLFRKGWEELMGWTPERVAELQAKAKANGMAVQYGIQAIGALLMAFVLAHAIIFAGAYLTLPGISAGLITGFMSWLGFVAPVSLGMVLWDGKPWKLWAINSGYYLVSLLLMGLILGWWS
jgi:hypothetical protein